MFGRFDRPGWLGKVLARLHARLPGGLGWGWCSEFALGQCTEKVFGCSYQELPGKSSSHNTTEHHHKETIVVSMGPFKKLVVNSTAQL